jgi:hypothetical protein
MIDLDQKGKGVLDFGQLEWRVLCFSVFVEWEGSVEVPSEYTKTYFLKPNFRPV